MTVFDPSRLHTAFLRSRRVPYARQRRAALRDIEPSRLLIWEAEAPALFCEAFEDARVVLDVEKPRAPRAMWSQFRHSAFNVPISAAVSARLYR